ncbi:25a5471b-935b-4e5c-a80b-af9979e632f7 [Sclerotinia trifoliorum]|uniref:N-acetylglucosamine-6-phosphate deacetylase n=1 Tax=Sclerotinia trifoliorum TaxID=28548 RepID=A0A8H2VQ72_9HELO|nr:25a5471b-935b-4e5c-a80b-af9979e632f7 [Sclerotinia trifoliorum]
MGHTQFINCRKCIHGDLLDTPLTIDDKGMIIPNEECNPDAQVVDLENHIVAPGFIDLQINGAVGFHFTEYVDPISYQDGVRKLSQYLPSTGVTAFYPTVPTVEPDVFRNVLPFLRPFDSATGASVLGAHVEGPFLAPSKKGAHNAKNLHIPESSSLETVYGEHNLCTAIKLVTMAPELPGASKLISLLSHLYGIKVSMGHSAASYDEGLAGIKAGANLLTHTFNAMNPLHHREPGLAGIISSGTVYFSLIADAIHLHPSIISLAYHSCPNKAILITDSVELSGLPDGLYPGHAQIPKPQLKTGNKVTISGTETLVGTCITLDECVRNLKEWAKIPIQKAIMTVTENVADAMDLKYRGKLEGGRRGDFVVMNEWGVVRETWILGKKVWSMNCN